MQAALELCLRKQSFSRYITHTLMKSCALNRGAEGVSLAAIATAREVSAEADLGTSPSAAEAPRSGVSQLHRRQEQLQVQQHANMMRRSRNGSPEDLSGGVMNWGSHLVKVGRLGACTTRRDVQRFFEVFDIDENSIRPEYSWSTNQIKAYWVSFKTAEERRRALEMNNRFLGPVPAIIMGESDARDLQVAMQKAPGASHSRGRVALVDNLSPGTSLSGLLRLFEGFHMQEHAATLLPKADVNGRQKRVSELSDSREGLSEPRLPSKKMQHQRTGPSGAADKARATGQAVVRFKTAEEAHRAVRQRSNSYVTNDCIRLRVLY